MSSCTTRRYRRRYSSRARSRAQFLTADLQLLRMQQKLRIEISAAKVLNKCLEINMINIKATPRLGWLVVAF